MQVIVGEMVTKKKREIKSFSFFSIAPFLGNEIEKIGAVRRNSLG